MQTVGVLGEGGTHILTLRHPVLPGTRSTESIIAGGSGEQATENHPRELRTQRGSTHGAEGSL